MQTVFATPRPATGPAPASTEVAGRRMPVAKSIGLAFLVGVAYFAAAHLGLALLVQPESVAVFWPASGIAGGALILLGRRGIIPVATGVFVATVVANLISHRNLPLAAAFGLCNAGEALLFAWLLRRQPHGRSAEAFGHLGAALWFFIAIAISTASMALLAVTAMQWLSANASGGLAIWKAWFASDAVGLIALAPMFMTFSRSLVDEPRRATLPESILLLACMCAVTAFTFCQEPALARLYVPLPLAALFPLLLWIAARCRPFFLAAGIAAVTILIVWATTNGLGHFGDATVALRQNVYGAQIAVTATAFCGLVLVAAFNDRRAVEAALRANDERFQKLAAAAPGLIYTFRVDNLGRRTIPYASQTVGKILGLDANELAKDAQPLFDRIASVDVPVVDAAMAASFRQLASFQVEARYQHKDRGEIWLEANSNPVRDLDGSTAWHGFIQDITQRKRDEAHIDMLTGEVHHRSNNLLQVVQAIAFHTARDQDPEHFVETFSERIAGLAASHDLLVGTGWEGVTVRDLAHSQLSHFSNLIGSRIKLVGADFKLKPVAAQALGMMLHELSTNAGKYGALSQKSGAVQIAWSAADDFIITWTETGGPPPSPPTRKGFGHRVLVEMGVHQLDGQVRLDYQYPGLSWQLRAPLGRVSEPRRASGISVGN